MSAPYDSWAYKESLPLAKVAKQLYDERPRPSRLAPLILMTDPKRLPNPAKALRSLPNGAAVIYRHFGAKDRLKKAEEFRQICFDKGLQFLIGDDPELAMISGADGVHFKKDAKLTAPMVWRARCPDWLISMAGLKPADEISAQDYLGDLSCLDGLMISSVFASRSPSAGAPIGVDALRRAAARLPVPVFALGGINNKTAPALIGSGAAGIAAIGGLTPA